MPPQTANKSTPRPSSSVKNTYLLAYNTLSAALWAGVLYQTVSIGYAEVRDAGKPGWTKFGDRLWHGDSASPSFLGDGILGRIRDGLGSGKVYHHLEAYTRGVQTLAGLEVLHSLLGIVRAPLLTTLMQVSSRFLLVWAIAPPYPWSFPHTTRLSPAYSTMLLAWSITEVVRYSYFVFVLSGTGVPRLWTWLRYNTFLVLYPLGVASECWLVWRASWASGNWVRYVLWGVLGVYGPGIWVLFGHMLKQRGRVMRDLGRA